MIARASPLNRRSDFSFALPARLAAARRLAEAAGGRLVYPVEANEVFLKVSAAEAAALRAQGFDFYDWGVGEARLVTSWNQDMDAVETLARAIEAL